MKPRIYDKSMNLIGVLQNATEVGYKHKNNDLYTAKFKLPVNDAKNELCNTFSIVDIFDGDESKGKYRILDMPDADVTSEGAFNEYSCEHVIAFLLNDVIDGYLELGGTGVSTATVIIAILAKQTVQRWKLGRCDFDYQFQYSWENTNLLEALFSIPTCFEDKYRWTYDTSSYPWTINLIRQGSERDCEIRRKRNMNAIKRKMDSSRLCTRLYCKGSGEGVNQLTIAEVNDGKPYIDADAATIAKYGILCSHYIDLTCTDASTLLAKGKQILKEIKAPVFTYTASAIDLYKATGYSWDKFDEGKNVRVVDEEKALDIDAMIIEVSKNDVDGKPLDMSITISSKSSDVSSDLEDLSRRAAITAQYSQGATNLYSQQYADNADAGHPAVIRVYIPDSCVKINQVLLSWQCSAFRAYSQGAEAGGNTTTTSGDGGGATPTSDSGGGTTTTTRTTTFYNNYSGTTSYTDRLYTDDAHGSGDEHTHFMSHKHDYADSMYIDFPALTVELPSHTHSVTVPSHSHSVTLPSHTHEITYGIYEGKTAQSCTLKVDNNVAQEGVQSGNDIDIIPYLSKDTHGKINRGTWHTIEIIPDCMTRIEANLFVQTFVTSYRGGNY